MSREKNALTDKDTVRVIKIGRQALLEFVYEKFIEEQAQYLDVDPTDVSDMFELDWDRGEFIFCAAKSEDADGNIIPFPKDIDLKKVMKAIPDTTDTMFRGGRYKEYTKDELTKLSGSS